MTNCGCGNANHLRHDDVAAARGTDGVWNWPVYDLAGDVMDWTGWSARAQARNAVGGTLRATWSTAPTGDEGEITLTDDGVTLVYTHAMTDTWTWPRAEFDILLTSPSGQIYRLTQASLTVSGTVTV